MTLNEFNKKLARISKDRFELRLSKNNIWYLYDYDFRELTRSKKELIDIIECMHLIEEFKELISYEKTQLYRYGYYIINSGNSIYVNR